MIACVDVHYFDGFANAAAILFQNWDDELAVDQFVVQCSETAEYLPGQFYQRELAPIVEVVSEINHAIETLVIDAYCQLSSDGAPGLGSHLDKKISGDTIIIGVAKTRFRDTNHACELLRGNSSRPLFITAIGTDNNAAADCIKSMHGCHRIPTMLKKVDLLARKGNFRSFQK